MGLNREERREKRLKRDKRTEGVNQWREKRSGGIKYIYFLEYCYGTILRALALKNANDISKTFLVFHS